MEVENMDDDEEEKVMELIDDAIKDICASEKSSTDVDNVELSSEITHEHVVQSENRHLDTIKVVGFMEGLPMNFDNTSNARNVPKCKASKSQRHSRSKSLSVPGMEPKRLPRATSKNFRRSVSELVTKVSDSRPWFVRCLTPSPKRKPEECAVDLVLDQLNFNGLLDVASIRRDPYEHRMQISNFMERFRDISFDPEDDVRPTVDNCDIILRDAGLSGYAFGKNQVYLRNWHGPVLQEIVAERKQMMATSGHICEAYNDVIELDNTVGVSGHEIAEEESECLELQPRLQRRHGSCTSTSSQLKVAEWMQQHEHLTFDVGAAPPYEVAPPPIFSKRESHVKIRLPNQHQNSLDTRLWDRFQMIPRERVSTSDTFRPLLRAFKVVCYLVLFAVVLGSAVTSKLCILLLASSVLKDEIALDEAQSPANTMLVVVICCPYLFWVLSYSAKSLFGSNSWPSFKTTVVTLFLELLHSFGLCLMVFHILPRMDMARGMLNFCGIYTVPAFLKTISIATDNNRPHFKRFALTFINGLAFLIQFSNLAASTMFSNPLSASEKMTIQQQVLSDENIYSVERPVPSFTTGYMWEIPVSLSFISISYWENFVEGDLSICTFTIPFLQWKRHLNSVRERLYIIVGIWKAGWTMLFAALLLPGFNFNIQFSNTGSDFIPANTTAVPSTTLHPYLGSGRNMIVKRFAISNLIKEKGVQAVLNLTDASLKDVQRDNIQQIATPALEIPIETQQPKQNDIKENSSYLVDIPENVKKNFRRYGPLYLQILCSALLSYFGSLACKLCMQVVGFTLPLFLATPVTLAVIIAQCYTQFIPSYLYVWLCPEITGEIRMFHLMWLGILWISQVVLTSHTWSPKNGRMAKIERLFVSPIRCGVLADQSLLLRRRTNDRDAALFNVDDDISTLYDDEEVHRADDVVPQIYACATMWHETRSEMTQLLKSLFRMDIDHSARYLAQRFYGIRDPDYYEFEAHVFFDDAMELSDDDKLVPNSFVAELMDCIDDALSSVHERQMSLAPPIRLPTPYGGRLMWRLPGGTRLIVHLKDKHKIRHKKRWSQVMYMYYLLGYRILSQPENLLHRDTDRGSKPDAETDTQRVKLTENQLRRRRQSSHFTRSVIFNYVSDEVHTQAENTFILTLDGDVDFKPDAVRLLVDRLKKNKKVGAACGRIHPVGSGPILWYQEFEYAIGHWLQKATEHVFGCVLCAPGCFSLFRGSALMDDNVARSYAIRTTDAGQYVQYDQGEDRWLSTLMLQQGYRIDYCAAADALTHAPETFSEFFNQRRRWGPSTLANVIDLLGDWKNTVRLNDNISTPYILYQFLLLISTILGPATVLLMMAGAFSVVFKTTVIQSYAISLIPAIVFIIICIYAKPTTQVTVATIMSACYAIVMTIVLIGTVGTAIDGSLTSPNVAFLVILVIIFFVSAMMHPEEFACVIPGALYFICIPTGYLVLTIYYLCNMHIVSWGTRELPKRKSKEEIEAEKRAAEEKRLKKDQRKGIMGWLGLDSLLNETVEMFKQIRQMTASSGKSKSNTDELLEELIFELRQNRDQKAPPRHRSFSTMTNAAAHAEKNDDTQAILSNNATAVQVQLESGPMNPCRIPVWMKNDDPENPSWLQNPVCGDGPIRNLDEREKLFWKQLIKKYLHPIVEDKVHQEKVAADLKNLRNNAVFGFFMTSALWIALTMQLQLLQDELKQTSLFIKIPHFDSSKKELTFEPLGMFFLALFAGILVFQFIGMLSHRWGTILHVLSITDVSCSKKFTEKYKIQEIITKTMELQRVINIENEPEPDYDDPIPDYEDDELDEDDETFSSMYTDSSSSVTSFARPPSYHSQESSRNRKRSALKRRNSAIFNKRGFSTGRTLRRAFERRYRNQLKREKSGEASEEQHAAELGRKLSHAESV